ncbi:hypothetical protein QNH39_12315 [Neobacillus novalis]|uniref:Uncharacterized protein n=1 Tax=Neobacillus novalis TaxID=220687 RepID=A0AA95MV36_9BACI|nr:hypothetical protein [Neobacillus novalis]WHY88570.1 hypothetical protein QNH39_12315 [Neobacillus novalis]
MKQSVYLSMEMQAGTEKLAEALVLRGFPVRVENDFITLPNGSQQDFHQLKRFLEKMQIPVFWNGDRFQLLTNHFPLQKMKEIIHFHGREHLVHMEGYHFKWRSFVNRRYGIRTNTINLCPFTAIMVKALNEAGIVTLTGCNGHGKHNPNFQLSGVYYGVWFSIIQQKYMKNLALHYKWKVNYLHEACNAVIMANKLAEERWDMKKVLADCYKMAAVLTENKAELRDWKRRTFKRNMKETAEALKETGDVHQLFDWMKKTANV